MKFTTQFRLTLLPASTLLCLFALMTPGICQAADGGAPAITDDWQGDTPLHRAIRNRDCAQVNAFLTDPTLCTKTIEALNGIGYTALDYAGIFGPPQVVRALLHLAQVTPQTIEFRGCYGRTALHLAAENSNPAVLHAFLACEKVTTHTIAIRDAEGWTAMHLAASCRNPEVLAAFFAYEKVTHTLINSPTAAGNTLLHILVRNRNMTQTQAYAATLMLLNLKDRKGNSRFTNIHTVDKDGLTSLHCAIKMNGHGSRHSLTPSAGQPDIFSALIGRTIRVKESDREAIAIIKIYGADSDEYKALIAQRSEESKTDAETDEEDIFTHEDQLRRTVDPNVGTPQRTPMY